VIRLNSVSLFEPLASENTVVVILYFTNSRENKRG